MSTLGKVCLCLTMFLLLLAMAPIPGKFGGWAPKLLVVHNKWNETLRDSRSKAAAAIQSEREAGLEFASANADLISVNTGWGIVWTVPPRAPNNAPDTPSLEKQADGRLVVRNVGRNSGMRTDYNDDGGAQQQQIPVVHAFYGAAGGYVYAGEFAATDVRDDGCLLTPVRTVTPQEVTAWPDNGTWRLRSMVPSGHRSKIDEWNVHLYRTAQLIQQADANIVKQQDLLAKAEVALAARRKELLGDPGREPVPNRPEFTAGLLQTIEDFEEERNQLQLNVDTLRRRINEEIAVRDERLQTLTQQTAQLPAPDVD
ncbi:MAG: hypothetical protein KDA89_06545 [Planctomycetaceae bacterium]|nr:hypothetical protein [Planctomycetaceae bacterium]